MHAVPRGHGVDVARAHPHGGRPRPQARDRPADAGHAADRRPHHLRLRRRGGLAGAGPDPPFPPRDRAAHRRIRAQSGAARGARPGHARATRARRDGGGVVMGLLMDIRSGKRLQTAGYAFVAWLIIGAGLGGLAGALLPGPMYVGGAIGALAGVLIGLYAEWGASAVAKVLAVPGMVLAMIW